MLVEIRLARAEAGGELVGVVERSDTKWKKTRVIGSLLCFHFHISWSEFGKSGRLGAVKENICGVDQPISKDFEMKMSV